MTYTKVWTIYLQRKLNYSASQVTAIGGKIYVCALPNKLNERLSQYCQNPKTNEFFFSIHIKKSSPIIISLTVHVFDLFFYPVWVVRISSVVFF